MIERMQLTAAQLAELRRAAAVLERAMGGEVALAIARRWAFTRSLEASATAAGVTLAQLSPAVARANGQADGSARRWAQLLEALRAGAAVVQPWAPESEAGLGPVRLGIARAGGLGLWQLVPTLVIGAASALAAAGGWVILDAWTEARREQATADRVRAETAAAVSSAITQAAKISPDAAAQLAQALQRANQAASGAQPSLLGSLAGAVDATVSTARDSGPWLALAAIYFFARRRKA